MKVEKLYKEDRLDEWFERRTIEDNYNAMADLLIEEYKETLGYMKLADEFEDDNGFLEHKNKADKILSVLTAAGIKITE